MATLITGRVQLQDGTSKKFAAGPRERMHAKRELGVTDVQISAGEIGEDYLLYLIFDSLKREAKLGDDVDFDAFIESHIVDYDLDEAPESPAPPAS